MSASRRRPGGREEGPSRPGSPLERWIFLIALVLVLLLYLRSPIDLLPDRLGGLGLIDDLVVAIAALWWMRRRSRVDLPRPERRRPTSVDGDDRRAWDPYRVLGVAPSAGPDEITRAYREQMKLYHPDRVAELGEELRALAHEKSLDIQRAYQELGPRRG